MKVMAVRACGQCAPMAPARLSGITTCSGILMESYPRSSAVRAIVWKPAGCIAIAHWGEKPGG